MAKNQGPSRVGQWIHLHLPPCNPEFKSGAHQQCFCNLNSWNWYYICYWIMDITQRGREWLKWKTNFFRHEVPVLQPVLSGSPESSWHGFSPFPKLWTMLLHTLLRRLVIACNGPAKVNKWTCTSKGRKTTIIPFGINGHFYLRVVLETPSFRQSHPTTWETRRTWRTWKASSVFEWFFQPGQSGSTFPPICPKIQTFLFAQPWDAGRQHSARSSRSMPAGK